MTLPKTEIERRFLSANFTSKQETEIAAYLSNSNADLKVAREFWNRRPIKAVGLAMKLNYWQGQEYNDPNPQIKEVRREAIRYFTGIGLKRSEDGVFTK